MLAKSWHFWAVFCCSHKLLLLLQRLVVFQCVPSSTSSVNLSAFSFNFNSFSVNLAAKCHSPSFTFYTFYFTCFIFYGLRKGLDAPGGDPIPAECRLTLTA